MIKIKIPYLLTVFVGVLLIFIGHKIAVDGLFVFQDVTDEVVRAKIERIVERVEPNFDYFDDYDDYGDYEVYDDFFPM